MVDTLDATVLDRFRELANKGICLPSSFSSRRADWQDTLYEVDDIVPVALSIDVPCLKLSISNECVYLVLLNLDCQRHHNVRFPDSLKSNSLNVTLCYFSFSEWLMKHDSDCLRVHNPSITKRWLSLNPASGFIGDIAAKAKAQLENYQALKQQAAAELCQLQNKLHQITLDITAKEAHRKQLLIECNKLQSVEAQSLLVMKALERVNISPDQLCDLAEQIKELGIAVNRDRIEIEKYNNYLSAEVEKKKSIISRLNDQIEQYKQSKDYYQKLAFESARNA